MKKYLGIFTAITISLILILSFSINVKALGQEIEPIIEVNKTTSELQEIIDFQFNTDLSEFPAYQNAMSYLNTLTPSSFAGNNYICYIAASNASTSQTYNCLIFKDVDKSIVSIFYDQEKTNSDYWYLSYFPYNYVAVSNWSPIRGNSPSGPSSNGYVAPGQSYNFGLASLYNLTSQNYYVFTNLDNISVYDAENLQTIKTADGVLYNANDVFLTRDAETGLFELNIPYNNENCFHCYNTGNNSNLFGNDPVMFPPKDGQLTIDSIPDDFMEEYVKNYDNPDYHVSSDDVSSLSNKYCASFVVDNGSYSSGSVPSNGNILLLCSDYDVRVGSSSGNLSITSPTTYAITYTNGNYLWKRYASSSSVVQYDGNIAYTKNGHKTYLFTENSSNYEQTIYGSTFIEAQENVQTNYIDFYYQNLDSNRYEFTLALKDEFSTGKNMYVDGFEFYGLINDNGLYHWEVINDLYMADYQEPEIENGYSINGYFFYENTKYEKIKLSVSVVNAFKYMAIYGMSDKNYLVVPNYFTSDYFYLTFNSLDNRYAIFTTKANTVDERIYSLNNEQIVYAEFFDIETYETTGIRGLDDYVITGIKYMDCLIGLIPKQGFYIGTNPNTELNYQYYHSLNVYYSLSKDSLLTDTPIIDHKGNNNRVDITLSEDNPDYTIEDQTTIDGAIKSTIKFLNDTKVFMTDIMGLGSLIFLELPSDAKPAIYAVFATIMLATIIINLRRN